MTTVAADSTSGQVPADHASRVASMSLEDLRGHRRGLLAESARAGRWQRLLQARLDLAVAAAAPVDDLSRPCEELPEPPDARTLRELVTEVPDDAIGLLRRLDAAQRALSGYGASVQTCASAATRELVERYARDPRGCLAAVPSPRREDAPRG